MSKYDRSQKEALNSYRKYNAFAYLLQSFFIKKIHRKILSVWKFNKIFICIGFWHFPLIRFCDRYYKFIWFSNSFLLPIAYVWEIRPVLLGRSYLINFVTNRSPITDHQSAITDDQSSITDHRRFFLWFPWNILHNFFYPEI